MVSNKPDVEKSIGRIDQLVPHAPEETTQDVETDGYPGVEFIVPPDIFRDEQATIVFKNGAKWQFRETPTGHIRREAFYSEGDEYESVIDDTATDPMEDLQDVFDAYSSRGTSWLKTEYPGFWVVLQ